MEQSIWSGLAVVSLGGVLTGAFAYPMARMKDWAWENIWLAYAFFGLVLIPSLVVGFSHSGFLGLYADAGTPRLLLVLLVGYLWGWGSATFGLGVDKLGMSLGFALILGITIFIGSIAPLLFSEVAQLSMGLFFLGLFLLVVGVALCGIAGHLRESRKGEADGAGDPHAYLVGVVICVVSGILSAFLNVGVSVSQPLQELAVQEGLGRWATGNIHWPLLLFGGFLANLTYCGMLLTTNQTWSRYREGGLKEWSGVIFMGAAWISGVFFYGYSAFQLGELGPVLGWPVFMSFIVLTAYGLGFLAGEWKGANRKMTILMNSGLFLMVVSLFIIGRSG